MSQTTQSSSHNPGYQGRLLCLSVSYCRVKKCFRSDEICDIIGDDGRHGFWSQETIHPYFHNVV